MKSKRIETKRMTLLALCVSVALILSYIEFLLPPILTIAPGIKLGLPNIVIIWVLYRLGSRDAIVVSIARLAISTLLFGNITMLWYSLAGAALSLSVMLLLKKLDFLSTVGVSVAGAIMHNIGQIIVAMALMQTSEIGYYMIVLAITGTVSGIFVGLCGAMLINKTQKLKLLKNI